MNIEISPKEYESRLSWDDAKLYCEFLIIDGKNDWRLPTIEELKEIYNSENDFFPAYYWSSTEYNAPDAWSQSLSAGYQHYYCKDTTSIFVRAVRTI